MKTQTPEQAREQLAAAEAEKSEAEQLAAALAEKVRSGDESVQPKDLTAARELAEFADLRISAARRKLDAAAEQDRHQRAELVTADARALVETDDPAELVAAVRAVADAAGILARLAHTRRDRIAAMGDSLVQVETELAAAGIDPGEIRHRYGVRGGREAVILYDPLLRVRSVRPGYVLAAALALGLSSEQLSELRDAMPSALVVGEQVTEAVPALADTLRHHAA
ncbi:hypothetical protein [Streptomyces sp. ISL-100]|uniref:hypothetical protein n=1 Tax=Streptomyces sp. ISL-100 TaxID=2819173 RepID=UPI001BEB1DA6|nr:hypothetical protein [Streptomyces sp. ISL-100]MBT2397228.1 hypothetical protein [Streptomyces sp. ISL-100]